MKRHVLPCAAAALFAAVQVRAAASVTLDVPEVIQEQDQWCWAATSAAVLAYYGHPQSQCAIAEYTRSVATWHSFGTTDCCANPSGACNYWNYNWGYAGSIQDILRHWNVPNSASTTYSLADVRSELAARRPFIAHWSLSPSGGHFVVGYGVSDSMVQIMDPWMGEGAKIAKYSWVVKGADHTWDLTNTLTNAPVTEIVRSSAGNPAPSVRATREGVRLEYRVASDAVVDFRLVRLDGAVVRAGSFGPRSAGTHDDRIEAALAGGGYVLELRIGPERFRTTLVRGD